MYDRLLKLYLQGRLTEAQLQNAVTKGWITQEEYERIIASK